MLKNLAIANCRVSSAEQMENNSLNRQNEAVNKKAEELGTNLVKVWRGHVSSKKGNNVNRKDLQEMVEYCKKNRRVKYVIFDEPDRFTRSISEMFYFIEVFRLLDVKIVFASKSFSTNTATDTLMLALDSFRAEGENEARRDKSLRGHEKALAEGRYPFAVHPGYMKGTKPGIHIVNPDFGYYLKSCLEKIALGLITPRDSMAEFNENCPWVVKKYHDPYTFDEWKKIISDPYYAGVVEMNKAVKYRNENGLHEPLISLSQHKSILNILANVNKKHAGPRKNGNPRFPLNRHLKCEKCASAGRTHKFTGYDNKNGRSDKIYSRYFCRGCNILINRDDAHSEFGNLVSELDFSKAGREALIKNLNRVWKAEEGINENKISHNSVRLQQLNREKDDLLTSLSIPGNASIADDIREMIVNKKVEIQKLEDENTNISDNKDEDKKDFLKFSLEFIDNISSNMIELPPKEFELCKNILFPSGFLGGFRQKVLHSRN